MDFHENIFFIPDRLILLLILTLFLIIFSSFNASGKSSGEAETREKRNNSYFTDNLYYVCLERENIEEKRETLAEKTNERRDEPEEKTGNEEELETERENADSEEVNRNEESIKKLPLFTLARTIGLEEFQVEGGFTLTTYKDDRPSKIASPFLLRIPLAERWEFRLSSDFLEFQSPYLDIDDATIGLTWLFRKNNPSMALRTTLKLSTGTPRVTDDAFLPGVHLSIDWRISDRWDISANLGWAAKNGGETSQYKDQKNKFKLGYRINDKNYLYFLIAKEFPDNSDRDYSLISGGIGYKKALTDKTQIIIEAIKFFSEGDKDWVIGISIGQSY